MENPAYQTVYGVGLLDDIHNYFPAILYDQGRFQTLPTLFSYVRHQMNTRFNLYSYGASLAGARTTPGAAPAAPTTFMRADETHTRVPPVEEDIMASIASVNLLLSLLQPSSGLTGLSGRGGISDFLPASRVIRTRATPDAGIWAAFRSPVVVAPSEEVLTANTQIITGSDLPSNTVCSVCQDSIAAGEACRRITACQHVYHRTCIDQWFTRSVYCPSCRHDIRVTSPRLQAAPTPLDPLPPLPPLSNAPAAAAEPSSSDETLFQALGYQ